ncbi:MAG: GMC family oxidoreductase [Bryobacterales bacterium]|nr:GMC family oxidoreductase [Bryobacterales bacterium]
MAIEGTDVVIVGSGAAGGMAAWNLTRKGVKVLLLEAGQKFERSQFWSHVKPWEERERRRRGEAPPDWMGTALAESPYGTLPGKRFWLARVWGVGGKTNIWGRVSLRYSDLNFQEPSKDGWEIPWPITYKEIAPYYDNVERKIGVCGGDENTPWLPGSVNYLPPPNLRCGEVLVRKAAKSAKYPVVHIRRAVLTRAHKGRSPCHYCGACGRGCDIGAFFNSFDYLLKDSLETGNLELVENALAEEILVNDEGLASGVRYFDRRTGRERTVPANRVIVAASAVDSTRLLLNSKSRQHPNGIGNGSDVIGRYLVEQVRVQVQAFAPELIGAPASNDDGISGGHIYIPRFEPTDEGRAYLRGFGVPVTGVGCASNARFAKSLGGFGLSYKQAVKELYPALFNLTPYGEVLPYRHNRITVDGTPNDRFGYPLLRIEYDIGENERNMASRMYDVVEEILDGMKAEPLPYERGAIETPGTAIHEHGTCRMGDDPRQSALNRYNQMHEVKNVFVMDGSAFPTATEKNPTLTILALAWRASDYMAEQMKRGEI